MVGTHTQPFDRLIETVDRLVAEKKLGGLVVAQIGNSTYEPKNIKWFRFLEEKDRKEILQAASVIITHAGAGSIIDALSHGKPTVVVPRLQKYGEHTNDHQLELSSELERAGKVVAVQNIENLLAAIAHARHIKPAKADTKLVDALRDYIAHL
jgi:UDP-N-acetylglucosamine transferase subunit ALG13